MRRLGLALALLLWTAPAWATTYYVRTDGNNANAGTANTAGGAWLTIDYAADHVAAGDTVRVQAGSYYERVTPGVNGSSGLPITYVADGAVTLCGWDITNGTYLRVIGFTVDVVAGGCSINNGAIVIGGAANSYLEFWHNTLTNARYNGIRMSTATWMTNSLAIGNVIHTMGIDNYSGVAVSIRGSHNVIGYNEVYNVDPDAFSVVGTYLRFLNNYARAMREDGAGHPDIFQSGSSNEGTAYNLFEATMQIGNNKTDGEPNEHAAQMSHANAAACSGTCGEMTENIVRRNVWHNLSSGTWGINQTSVGPISDTRYYHNTTADANTATAYASNRSSTAWYNATNPPNGSIWNNIEWDGWGSAVTTGITVYGDNGSGAIAMDYNLAFDPDATLTFAAPWTGQAHPRNNIDPKFTAYTSDEFTLASDSGAIGNAGPLTTTSGSGTGTTFNVATNTGGFFVGSDAANVPQYGGALVTGDTITVGTDVVTVVSVTGDALTVTPSFTWANGESVYFGSDTTPDIGAYPYKAGGYTLSATYASAGGTTTMTPNDASLVRFAVCYSDGVPVTVDNSNPYTCPTPTGTVAVRVYPLYASKILWAVATVVAPAAPTNVRIR